MLFAADIGATNSRFALFSHKELDNGDLLLTLEREHWLAGADFPSFDAALDALFSQHNAFLPEGQSISAAALALAGPIVDGVCKISNLPWRIESRALVARLGTKRLWLLNDFAAQGCACLIPAVLTTKVLQAGTPDYSASQAVIGAGTGLGKSLLLPPLSGGGVDNGAQTDISTENPEPSRHIPRRQLERALHSRIIASEGGHSDFPFVSPEEYEFAAFIRKGTGKTRIIGDMVVTGSGLGHLYAFHTGKRLPDKEATSRALEHPEIVPWFARFYGRACRNFVLETLSLQGLLITGGMALRLPVLEHPAFFEEFICSAAHERLLRQVPVKHVRSHQTGLWGTALYAILAAAR